MRRALLGLCTALLLIAPSLAPAASPRCDPAGRDRADVQAARATVEAECACDAFPSHARYVRCIERALDAIPASALNRRCRGTVGKIAKQSICSFQRKRVVCCEGGPDGARCTIRDEKDCVSTPNRGRTACAETDFCADAACTRESSGAFHCGCVPGLLYGAEGNRLRRYDIDTIASPPLVDDVLIPSASDDAQNGRDINGQICAFPDDSGRFIAGEDTGQPHPPPGWGVFASDGTQIGKLAATYQPAGDSPEPFGCGFDTAGRLFTTDVGNQADGGGTGQLLIWFPPYDRFPGPPGAYPNADATSGNFCKLATDLGTAGSIAIDDEGRVYVTAARDFTVFRFSPPFPTSPDAAGGCGAADAVGSRLADRVQRAVFINDPIHLLIPSGIARARNGNWFVSNVFFGVIAEFDPHGVFVRRVLSPPGGETAPSFSTGNPFGLAVDCRGDLYYADLRLRESPGGVGPGPGGKVWHIAFDPTGAPSPPMIVKDGLTFPDGVSIVPGDLHGAAR